MIKVFTSTRCPSCKLLYKLLTDKNIQFELINIDDNILAAKENKIKCLPTIIKDNIRIEGFNRNKLKDYLDI